MLDPVPSAGAGRDVADADLHAEFVWASACISCFHSRRRDPLLPPLSAVIVRRL